MAGKSGIIRELGESGLLLPEMVNSGLTANDQVKYFFTLLQTAQTHADHPNLEYTNLSREREAAGIESGIFDHVVSGAKRTGPATYLVPELVAILGEVRRCFHVMQLPITRNEPAEAEDYMARMNKLLDELPEPDENTISGRAIADITRGDPSGPDSLHVLLMDMHKSLNNLQKLISTENIAGAMTYNLPEEDKCFIRAFMSGVNRTAPLKFDHPGLGTTATRSNGRIVIQNDIGLTDAHILVIHVEQTHVSIKYTDIHMPRLQFFQGLFESWNMVWDDTRSRKGDASFEKRLFHLSTGSFLAKDEEEQRNFLEFLGSRIVFLIDWNRARKRLRSFLPNKDSVAVIRWAAEHEVGHVGFLQLGGEQLIYDGLEMAARIPLRYGEPLYQILGRERTLEYFQWVFNAAAKGLLANHSRLLIQDEIKAELLRYFHSAHENLMEICEQHATLTVEVAMAVRDALLHIQRKENGQFTERTARRAKVWESEADNLVSKVRSLSLRFEAARQYTDLINVADDALDFLEEASFFTTLVPRSTHSEKMLMDLVRLGEIALKGSQEYLKAVIASQYMHKGYSREEMQDFIRAIDGVISMEREADEALRNAEKVILAETTDYKELRVFFEIARIIESSTNSLMKAAFVLRNNILESLNW
ncbi:MAG: hypothetical protein WCP36_03400 [Methanomicrobiales archaeon]